MRCSLLLRVSLSAAPKIIRKPADPLIWRRHESSFRRTQKRLRVKPDPSFQQSQAQDHIIFNPPSSLPSVYHTPMKFLPKGDRRRALFSNSTSTTSPTISSPTPAATRPQQLPNSVRQPYEKQYHLTALDFDEMRRLRREDDVKWTRPRLAEKFNCSQYLVGLVVQASKEKLERDTQSLEAVKAKWGRKRKMAREDRIRRRDTWGREE